MNEREIEDIRKRNEERKSAHIEQRGCVGSPERRGATHHGKGSLDCPLERHHHHDDRCEPSVDMDIDALLAEVERLQYQLDTVLHVAVHEP